MNRAPASRQTCFGGRVDRDCTPTAEPPPNYILGVAACALTGVLFAVFVAILAHFAFTH